MRIVRLLMVKVKGNGGVENGDGPGSDDNRME